jgi:hypothetical protein
MGSGEISWLIEQGKILAANRSGKAQLEIEDSKM